MVPKVGFMAVLSNDSVLSQAAAKRPHADPWMIGAQIGCPRTEEMWGIFEVRG